MDANQHSRVTANTLYPAGATRFGEDFKPEEIVLDDWGTLTLDYGGCDSITLDYQSTLDGFGSGTLEYVRLTSLVDTVCDL